MSSFSPHQTSGAIVCGTGTFVGKPVARSTTLTALPLRPLARIASRSPFGENDIACTSPSHGTMPRPSPVTASRNSTFFSPHVATSLPPGETARTPASATEKTGSHDGSRNTIRWSSKLHAATVFVSRNKAEAISRFFVSDSS